MASLRVLYNRKDVRPLIQIGMVLLCWAIGIFLALHPSSDANLDEHSLLGFPGARSLQLGDQVCFEGSIPPAHQMRWAESLQLQPIPPNAPLFVPDYSILSRWSQRKPFQRAPYSIEEVQEWWNQNGSMVSKGYARAFLPGGYIVLDLQEDRLTGWLELNSWEGLLR